MKSAGLTTLGWREWVDLPELEPMLAEAGLSVARAYAHFDKTPFDRSSERLICVAEKIPPKKE